MESFGYSRRRAAQRAPGPRLRQEGEVRAPRGSRQMSRDLTTEEGQIPVFQLITLYREEPLRSTLGERRKAVKESV
ncbi:hypothetical protein AV530_017833 [Patagioenas fasciata monilis]|uniref:Uncharacterized protein n=1 Tax=Patagioenas fasciata monilis TaxID=372326 RepID=A0A1V4J8G6_PATFA|nr:hypothetical protein AV530_017833 [Patagioenas fasciata monilis]